MKEIEQVIHDFRKAVLTADRTHLINLLADDLSYGHSDGFIESKEDFISRLANGTYRFTTMELSHQSVWVSDNVAIVRQKRAEHWQLIARQAVKKRQ